MTLTGFPFAGRLLRANDASRRGAAKAILNGTSKAFVGIAAPHEDEVRPFVVEGPQRAIETGSDRPWRLPATEVEDANRSTLGLSGTRICVKPIQGGVRGAFIERQRRSR